MRVGGLRTFLLAFAVVAIPLGVLAVAGATVALRELAREREAATEHVVGVVAALVGEAQDALRREAFILARDPALVQSAAKGDWAPLARWGSPRMLALTRDGVADLLIVRDARGGPVVQVPVLPRTSLPESPATGDPRVSLALVDGRPYFLATAAVANPWVADTAADRPLGTVAIGRSVESLRRVLDRAPARPGLVVLAGDRVLASTRPGTPEGGWSGAVRAGRATVDREVFALRPLAGAVPGPGAALWALVPETELVASTRRLWSWLIALSFGGALILALAVGVIIRGRGAGGRSARAVPGATHLDAAREALSAIALTIGRGRDLVATAEETLDAVSRAVGIAVGIVYRLDAPLGTLVLLAQRGIEPEMLDRSRTRPLDGSYVGEAARTGQTLVTDLTTAVISDSEFRQQAERRGHQTQLALPIPVEDRIWGVLVLVSTERRAFAPDELTALGGIAYQVGLAVHRAELADIAATHLRRLEALREIERHISEQLDLDRLLVIVARSALSLIGGTFSVVCLRDGDVLRPGAWAGIDDWIGDIRIPVGAGVVGQALETGEGLIVNDYANSPLALEPFKNATLRLLAHPLVGAGQGRGVMLISRDEASAPFSAEDLSALADLATQASVAIDNARLFAETRRSAEQYQALFEVAGLVGSTLDIDRIIELIVDRCRALMGVAAAGLFRLDEAEGAITCERGAGFSSDFVGALKLRVGEGTTGRAVAERAPVWTVDLLADPAAPVSPEVRMLVAREGYRAVLSVPVIVKGRVHGALAAYWWEPRTPSPSEISLMTALAGQAGLALDNARLYGETAQHLRQARALLEVAEIIESTLDPQRLLKQVAIATARVCGVDRVSLERWDGDHVIPLMSQFADGRRDERLWAAFTGTPSDPPRAVPAHVAAMETRRPVIVADVSATDLIPREWAEMFGQKSSMIVPLVRQDQVIGVMTLDYTEHVAPFEPWQVSLAAVIAGRLALSIDNARLFQDNQRRMEELSVLHETSRAVTGRLDQAGLLETIYQQLARLLDVRHLVILLHEGDRLDVALRVVDGARRDGEPRSYPETRAGLSAIVLSSRRGIRTDDYAGECARRGVEAVPESDGVPHWLGVPMVAGEERLGVLALSSRDRSYTEADERLLAGIADLAALALSSARLYEQKTRAHADLAAAQDQLVRTEKLRAMGEMASGMAHDFNNVLAAILGRAQLLLGRVEDPVLKQWLLVIERAAMDGAHTVRRLQEFTRIRRDQPAELVDWNRVVEETLEATELSWRQEPRSRGVAIEVETALAEPLPAVSGDAAELREALTNLILNAVDAMPGGGRLHLATRSTDGHVEVTVADTGTGIAAGIRDSIFDPFFTTKGPKGTGLGLSMTYGILARHDGRITVESEEGRGTTFRLVFAAAADNRAARAADAPLASAPGGLRCLVVDDEVEVGEVLGDMLRAIGHEATVVTSGKEIPARLRAQSFDLVLTDLAMPEMTGWDVAQTVKAIAPEMPVVLVTGFAVEVVPADLAKNGVELVLAKPLAITDVRNALAQVKPRGRETP